MREEKEHYFWQLSPFSLITGPQRLQEMLSGLGETKHQPEETPETPSITDSCFRKSVEGNRKEWSKWEKLQVDG